MSSYVRDRTARSAFRLAHAAAPSSAHVRRSIIVLLAAAAAAVAAVDGSHAAVSSQAANQDEDIALVTTRFTTCSQVHGAFAPGRGLNHSAVPFCHCI